MHKVKVRLPATVTDLGPGLHSLGLALGLYTTVEVSERRDEALVVELAGEGAERYSPGLRHPVTLALMRLFQRVERAPLGISVKIDNQIPLDSGLGAETAFLVAAVTAANNLLGLNYSRDRVLELAAQISQQADRAQRAEGVPAAVLGGLTAATMQDGRLIYRALPVAPLKVVVALPAVEEAVRPVEMPERAPIEDVTFNLSRVPLLVDALREGDLRQLADILDDRLRTPHLIPTIPGYAKVVEAGLRAGALAVTICGDGPGLLAFAEEKHEKIAEAMQVAFMDEGVKARAWTLPVDTQGIVLSMLQSS